MVEKDEGLPIGTILLDRYRIERKIGEGGMSHVYLASDQWRNITNAVIKMPFADLLGDRWIIKKFKQEAESLARLKHQGIVELLGHGVYEVYPFVILEYVEGVTLKEIMGELPADPQRAVRILTQIINAVEHAHEHEIFHRDLKPDNVMVRDAGTADEHIKLIDFGIAHIDNSFFVTSTNTRYQVGTPHYISPNRLRHDPNDRADDIYALGLIAYEMLTGTNPLKIANDFTELKRLQEQILPPCQLKPDLPKALDRELIKALSLDHANRHSTALELGQRLREAFSTQKKTMILPTTEEDVTRLYPSDQKKQPYVPQPAPPIQEDFATTEESYNESKLLAAVSPGEKFLIGGDFDSAIIFYSEKLKTNERSDLFHSRRVMAFLMKKDFENAALDCQNALKIFPDNDFAHLIRGILYRLKLWTAEAETELLKAIKLNQNNIVAALVLGDIYASRGEAEKALNYYSHITRVNPHFSWTYTNRGNLYYNRRDYDAAIADFTSAIKTNPDLAWNYFQREKHKQKPKNLTKPPKI